MTSNQPLTPPLPKTRRISTPAVLGVAGGFFGVALVLLILTLSHRQRLRKHPKPAAKPSLFEVSGPNKPTPDVALRLQQSYAGWNREPKPPPPPPAPPSMFPPDPAAGAAGLSPIIPPARQANPLPPAQPLSVPAGTPARGKQSPTRRVEGTSKKTARKLFAEMEIGKPPFEPPKASGAAPGPAPTQQANPLLKPANWITPADPMHTLFRSQVIHGVLLDAINSDSPSQVRVKVTRPVMDKFQVGEVLIPQHAIILGQAEGSPNFGQARMNVTLDEIEYPNGTLLNLTKQKLGDQSGAGGLGATVNNHYLQVGIGAVLSAFLSVGARSFGGTGGGAFQSSPELELSRNVSGQFNQTGQDVIRRELMRAPTLTVPAGTAVTLSLTENLSLSRPPVPQR